MRGMLSVEEVKALIAAGERLLLAGDEDLLRLLPKGDWVGGTIPYFICKSGAVMSREKIFTTVLPPEVLDFRARFYDEAGLPGIVGDEPHHGFSFLIIPAFSWIHQCFAENVQNYAGIFDRPLVGWVAGVASDEIGKKKPRVVLGQTGEWSEDRAVCVHAELAASVDAEIGIVNPFTQGDGPAITVERSGFRIDRAWVDGRPVNLAEYLVSQDIDCRLPLVANYCGAMVNVSIKFVNYIDRYVELYAPMFHGIEYKPAVRIDNYEGVFANAAKNISPDPIIFMNCILNYVYGNLTDRLTGDFTGPITFGEIAYGLLNQTIVYMVLRRG